MYIYIHTLYTYYTHVYIYTYFILNQSCRDFLCISLSLFLPFFLYLSSCIMYHERYVIDNLRQLHVLSSRVNQSLALEL